MVTCAKSLNLIGNFEFHSIPETAMGTKINAQDSKDSAYVTAIYE